MARIPCDVWSFHLLYHCDLVSLIRLSGVNRMLRNVLQTPEFVVRWQTRCWFLYRDCLCDRNLFYVDVSLYCDFLWEHVCDRRKERTVYHGMLTLDQTLRRYGRSLPMLMDPQRRGHDRIRFLDPTTQPDYAMGMSSVYLEDLVVPVPRMLPVPVEYASEPHIVPITRMHPELWDPNMHLAAGEQGPDESLEAFQHRNYWRNIHPIPYQVPDPMRSGEMVCHETPPSSWPTYIERDHLEAYLEYRAHEDRDPYDPNDDDDCEGYHTAQWVRHRMYETGVGNQQYPMDLCLHPDELSPLYAKAHGVDYLERLYLPLHKWNHTGSMYDHRGIVYTHGVRYNHERGDFVPWALHTLALLHSMYLRLWVETTRRFTQQCYIFARNLALELEEVMSATSMLKRIRQLEGISVTGPVPAVDWLDAIGDIHRKLFLEQGRYHTMHQLVRQRLEMIESNQRLHSLPGLNLEYLSNLVPMVDHTHLEHLVSSTTGSEGNQGLRQLVMDVYRLMDTAMFVADFALYLGPREHPSTMSFRRSSIRMYLQWCESLLLFHPGWRMDYDVKPSRANVWDGIRVPRVELTHNHRYQRYLRFLNERILYHTAEWNQGYDPNHCGKDLNRHRTGAI